jgi:L-fuculokinase
MPVKIIKQSETTVLGAALFAFVGAGVYSDYQEMQNQIDYRPTLITPQN